MILVEAIQPTHYWPYVYYMGPCEILPIVFSCFFAPSQTETGNKKGLNLLDEYSEDKEMFFYFDARSTHVHTPPHTQLYSTSFTSPQQIWIFLPYKYPQIFKIHFSQNLCSRWCSKIINTCDKTRKDHVHLKTRPEFTPDGNSAWMPILQGQAAIKFS